MNKEIEYIESQGKFGMKLGLERIENLLNKLGRPQDNLTFIHIAGSNGKGSIARILETVLVSNEINTGLYTSPHLERINERIRVNKIEISDSDFDRIFKKVKKACEEIQSEGNELPTGFEIETAMALLYFLEKEVDLVILEVGLGGRLDATNVIDKNLISVIASISLEHTQWLGDSIEEIALEKSAIIKNGSNVIIAPQKDKALEVIRKDAKRRGAKSITSINNNDSKIGEMDLNGQEFIINNEIYKLPLLGLYQKDNFSTALSVLKLLKKEGYPIEDLKKGLSELSYPGRFEVLSKKPVIILDGAHNPDGLRVLTQTIETLFKDKKIILFFGMLKDKNIIDSLKLILPIVKEVYLLKPNNPEAEDPETIAKIINELDSKTKTKVILNIEDITDYINLNDSEEIYIIAGSLYLIGIVRPILIRYLKTRN